VTSGVTIDAHFEAMSALARRLSQIHAELEHLPANGQIDEQATGAPVVATALEHFCTSWSVRRKQVAASVDAAAQVVMFAVREYERSEKELIAQGGKPAPGAADGRAVTGPVKG